GRTPGPRADMCLVTGASGFIGGHLAKRLVAEGHRVRCLVRATSDTSGLEGLGVELARGDLTDADSLKHAAEGCRFLLHCGALVSDWATVEEIEQANVAGTRNVLAAASAASIGSTCRRASATGTRRPSAQPRRRFAGPGRAD